MEAVREADLGICDVLLKHGAAIEAVDGSGENVMHWAARYVLLLGARPGQRLGLIKLLF